ncbi:MAG: cell division protein FtsL [Pseudomonadota bacterium]
MSDQRYTSVWLVLALALAVVMSALALVYTKHEARKSFVELQNLTRERDQLNIEWGQLTIEQSTFATHGRVEQVAIDELELKRPALADIYVVEDAE